jgi:hypothetical protein
MKKIVWLLAFSIFTVSSIYAQHKLVKKWETDTLFKVPESILWDAKNQVFYVSNVDGKDSWGRDGKGSVGRMTRDGKIIDVEWVTGMDAPKGMGMHNGKLYVADFEHIIKIDIASGRLEKKILVKDAIGLNDLAIDPSGVIFVSDSKGKRIFKVENEQSSVFIDSLKGPNGILLHNGAFYAVNGDGLYRIEKDRTMTTVATGIVNGNTDGLTAFGEDFIVSIWQGSIWYVYKDGRTALLLDSREQKRNTADLWFDKETNLLYVPGFFTNTITAYEVK